MEKPVLAIIFHSHGGYKLKNVGKGVANNIILLHSTDRKKSDWDTAMKCYSLGNNDEFDLSWAVVADELVAIYFDVFNQIHISYTKDDQLEMIHDLSTLHDIKVKILSKELNIEILNKKLVKYSQVWNYTSGQSTKGTANIATDSLPITTSFTTTASPPG